MSAPVTETVPEHRLAKPCECPSDHPVDDGCQQQADYAVRIRHIENCEQLITPLLCQNCLNDYVEFVEQLLGAICSACGFRVRKVEDMVGPVIPL